jgi:hypothetical protein
MLILGDGGARPFTISLVDLQSYQVQHINTRLNKSTPEWMPLFIQFPHCHNPNHAILDVFNAPKQKPIQNASPL